MWAADLPNCAYCVTAPEIHDKLISLYAECQRRSAHVRAHATVDGTTDHIDVGRRLYVLCEEMNATTTLLQAYWPADSTERGTAHLAGRGRAPATFIYGSRGQDSPVDGCSARLRSRGWRSGYPRELRRPGAHSLHTEHLEDAGTRGLAAAPEDVATRAAGRSYARTKPPRCRCSTSRPAKPENWHCPGCRGAPQHPVGPPMSQASPDAASNRCS